MSPKHHAEFDGRVAEIERDPALLGYIVESWADRAESLLRTPEEQARVVSARIRRIFGDDVDPRTVEVVCWQFLPPPFDAGIAAGIGHAPGLASPFCWKLSIHCSALITSRRFV
jgi:hypothetical protein